jgi:hypothetical protein
VVDLHARVPLKSRCGNIVVLPDPDDRRIRIETGEDWIANQRHVGGFEALAEKQRDRPDSRVIKKSICLLMTLSGQKRDFKFIWKWTIQEEISNLNLLKIKDTGTKIPDGSGLGAGNTTGGRCGARGIGEYEEAPRRIKLNRPNDSARKCTVGVDGRHLYQVRTG